MRSPWFWWSASGRRTTRLPPPRPSLIRPHTAFTAWAGRAPVPRDTSFRAVGRALGSPTPRSTPPWEDRAHRLPGHRHPGVPNSSGAHDSSHRRADDRDRRRPKWGGDSAGDNCGPYRGQGTDRGGAASRRHGVRRRNRGQRKESSSDGRSRRYRRPGDASQASSSRLSTDGSGKAPVPEVTTSSKEQVVHSLTGVVSSSALLGRLTMPDDVMPVSPNLAHARTTAIDSAVAAAAAAAAAKTHTLDV